MAAPRKLSDKQRERYSAGVAIPAICDEIGQSAAQMRSGEPPQPGRLPGWRCVAFSMRIVRDFVQRRDRFEQFVRGEGSGALVLLEKGGEHVA
jgi:hypothetical protein